MFPYGYFGTVRRSKVFRIYISENDNQIRVLNKGHWCSFKGGSSVRIVILLFEKGPSPLGSKVFHFRVDLFSEGTVYMKAPCIQTRLSCELSVSLPHENIFYSIPGPSSILTQP